MEKLLQWMLYIGSFLGIYFLFSIRTQNKMHSNGKKINKFVATKSFQQNENQKGFVDT